MRGTAVVLCMYALAACSGSGSTAVSPPLSGASGAITTRAIAASPAPSQVGLHIHGTMTWYQGINVNTDVPASWMAAHYDITEQGFSGASYAANFLSDGGKYAVLYTDPELLPFCSSPFSTANGAKPGACTGPIGNMLNNTESAWLHDASLNRLHVTAYGFQPAGHWQDRANPSSSALQSAYHTWSTGIVAGTKWNAFEIDDFQTGYLTWYFQYKEGATSREFDALGANADAVWTAGQQNVINAAARPVFLNGIINYGEATILAMPKVLGHMFESCATTITTNPVVGQAWRSNLDHLLNTTFYKRDAICVNYAPSAADGTFYRLYGFASWLLTYDPVYSVIFESIKTADGHYTYPEQGLAVFSPLQSPAARDVLSLRLSSGVYRREFAYCYVQKVAIGPCAALVNPDSVAHTIPALTYHYAHYMKLSTASWYAGGTITWASSPPTTLAAMSAMIVKK